MPFHLLGQLVWYSLQLLPLAAALAATVAAAVIWLYAPQVRLLSRPWRWVLPGLRALAMLALVGSMLKPVAIRQRSSDEEAAILLLVDKSRSMSVHDLRSVSSFRHPTTELFAGPTTRPRNDHPQRSERRAVEQLVALADVLGLTPPGVRSGTLLALQADVQHIVSLLDDLKAARGERDYARLSGRGVEEAEARVTQATAQLAAAADDLASRASSAPPAARLPEVLASFRIITSGKAADDVVREATGLTAAARDAINHAQVIADGELYATNEAVRAACDKVAGMSRYELIDTALTQPDVGLLNRLGASTPIFGFAIADEATPIPLRGGGRPVETLGLIPDGAHSDLTGTLRDALARVKGVPLQAVVVFTDGQQVGGDTGVISSLSASGVPIFGVLVAPLKTTFKDVAISKVTLPSSPFAGETITVRAELTQFGMKGAATDVQLNVDGTDTQTRRVAFTDSPTANVEFSVKLGKPSIKKVTVTAVPLPDEVSEENNTATRWVKVLADKVKVAAITSTPGWDYQYIRNALARTPWVMLDDAVLEEPGAVLSLTPEKILGEDVIILSDVAVAALSDAQWDAVVRLVTDRGGSAILIAGDAHLPAEYSSHPFLSSLLPYRQGMRPAYRAWPGKEPNFHLAPAPGAENVDALKLDDSADPQRRWGELPAMFRYLPIPDLKPNARPLLIERDSNSVVLTESRLGLGRVFFFGADETWRWRFKVGERDQDRFWLQMIRYAADEPYAAKANTAWLDADDIAPEPNQAVHLRAKLFESPGVPVKEAHSSVQIWSGDKLVRSTPLSPTGPIGAGRFQGAIDGLPTGEYELRLVGPDGNQKDYASLPLHVAPNYEAEMANLAGSEWPVRRLAESTGGSVLTLEQIGSLPDRIAKARTEQAITIEKPLWDSYYLFFFVLACLGTEWGLRKRLGLV